MENKKVDFFDSFFLNLPKLIELITPYAKRSLITAEGAILLMIYSEFPNLKLPVKAEIELELISKGLVKIEQDKPVVTSKGAILAKSFIGAKKDKF